MGVLSIGSRNFGRGEREGALGCSVDETSTARLDLLDEGGSAIGADDLDVGAGGDEACDGAGGDFFTVKKAFAHRFEFGDGGSGLADLEIEPGVGGLGWGEEHVSSDVGFWPYFDGKGPDKGGCDDEGEEHDDRGGGVVAVADPDGRQEGEDAECAEDGVRWEEEFEKQQQQAGDDEEDGPGDEGHAF